MLNNKAVLGMIVAVVVLLGGGVYLMSRGQQITPNPTDTQMREELRITASDHVKGQPTSSVALIEYADFQCPACAAYYPLVTQLAEEYQDKIAIVVRNYPLPMHKNAEAAARIAEAAHRQGKYWEMHNALYENQEDWSEVSNPTSKFAEYAKAIGLDASKLEADTMDAAIQDKINNDVVVGNRLGVNSTPSFFLAGEKIPNPQSIEAFRTLIDAALLKQPVGGEVGASVHEHADMKVYLAGKQLDLSASKYQSTEEAELDPDMHMHDGNGEMVHKHKTGRSMAEFFGSLKIDLTDTCLILDTGTKYCTDANNSLKFYVNGQPKTDFSNYEFQDLDRMLISYGPVNQNVQSQIDSIGDMACMYSEKCPERGTPPTENCVGGLGSDC